jgi:S1-C subfamily serine protease
MKMRIVVLVLALLGGFLFFTSKAKMGVFEPIAKATKLWSEPSVAQSAGLSNDETNNVDIYKLAHPATVNISSTVYQRDWFMRLVPSGSIGSGFVINENGQILTNYHVVAGSDKLSVTLADKSKYEAVVLDKDPANDLALIQIKPRKKLPFLRLGDSEVLQVGQKVLAIGNPFGLEGTLTTGIVSSLGRTIRDEQGNELEGLIQTDAAINSGNSGGPLLDSKGAVIGINTAILGAAGNIGIGFAMPISRARRMLDDFQAGRGYAPPARIGVNILPVAGELAEALDLPAEGGLLVQNVIRGSSAWEAGIRAGEREVIIGNQPVLVGGDLIMAVEGKPIERSDAIPRALARKRAGDDLELTVFRRGKTTTVKVKLQSAGPSQRL